jgi:hypothetical protein
VLAKVLSSQSFAEIGSTFTFAFVLAWRLPQLIDSIGRILKIILKYQLARKKVPERAKLKQINLRKKIEVKRAGQKK